MNAAAAYVLYFVFALGGAGVYFLLPKARHSRPMAGLVIGLLALAGLLTVFAIRGVGGASSAAYFYIFASITLIGSTRVITHTKPVYSALYFVLVVVAVSALLVLQRAEFLAVALIIIYAGAILVTYLFVIMLAHQGRPSLYDRRSREPLAAVLVGAVLAAAIATRATEAPSLGAPVRGTEAVSARPLTQSDSGTIRGNTFALGTVVVTRHVVVFELAGLLLLISMIGAVALSRKRVPTEVMAGPPLAPGQLGREVPPF